MATSRSTGTMRALLLTKPAGASTPTLSLTTSQPIPVPAPGELLVRVHASAIQPSDILNMRGSFGLTTFPRIPGRDFSGVIVASGGPAPPYPLDTAVFGSSGSTHSYTVDGFHAEYAVVPADAVTPKPASLSHVQAASVGVPFTTAKLTVQRSGAKRGETALVLGANGAVGKTACMLLEELGCRVLRAVRGPGGDIDTVADPGLKAVRKLKADGVDVVIDTVGLPAMTKAAIDESLSVRGRLVFISAPKGEAAPELTFSMRNFYQTEKSVIGVNSLAHGISEMAALLRDLQGVLESGRREQAVAGKWEEVSLEDAVAAYQSQEKGKKFMIRMV